ncbi:YybH family protein [Haliscomenobacter sp.]|uniref:YybH family protein n=1 Tax=Haliscomenobacter sp. TaxID=2717303 RepID=UPI003BAABC8F
MKISPVLLTMLFLLTACQSKVDNQNSVNNQNKMEMDNEKAAIEKLLFTYRDALNASNTDKVLPLYTATGVFMPSNAPTSVGQDQVKGAYDFVFNSIQLKIEFFIDEIEVHGDIAFARTTSKGTTLIHATGETVPEENRELFVLQKENGQWKIARYMFNKTK